MKLSPLPVIKEDERGIMWGCDKLNFISRKQGTVSANHNHADAEILYLVHGTVELTIANETGVVEAPLKIEIDAGQYHKLVALTDIQLLVDRVLE